MREKFFFFLNKIIYFFGPESVSVSALRLMRIINTVGMLIRLAGRIWIQILLFRIPIHWLENGVSGPSGSFGIKDQIRNYSLRIRIYTFQHQTHIFSKNVIEIFHHIHYSCT